MNNPCKKCDCWDFDKEQCTMPSIDHWYACPIENKKPENIKELEEYIKHLSKIRKEVTTNE